MKKIIIVFAAIFLSTVLFALFVYYPSLNNGEEAVIGIDITDSLRSRPLANEIISKLGIERNKWASATIRINTISGFDYNTVHTIDLPSRLMILSNPTYRDSVIAKFERNFATELDEISNTDIGRPQSNIYSPLVRELNRLAKSKAKKRMYILYGDCRHNMQDFSIYRVKDLELLIKHPEIIRDFFKKMEKPNDLTGIDVYFIFEPKSSKENTAFFLMANLFKSIFTEAGAKVHIAANLAGADDL